MARNLFNELVLRARRLSGKGTGLKRLVSRRFLLTTFVRLPLAAIVMSSRRSLAAWRPRLGASHTELTIAAVISRMLPTDELPGGVALGVDRRINALTDSELKRSFVKGVAWLDGQARREGATNFLELDEARQEAVLEAALASGAEGAQAIVSTLRWLAFTLYYTDPAIMAAFRYSGPPQPVGFPDFQEAPK
jgi:Gluconate 2-dehydrogenase subunit 3